jgi:hypothetical protein
MIQRGGSVTGRFVVADWPGQSGPGARLISAVTFLGVPGSRAARVFRAGGRRESGGKGPARVTRGALLPSMARICASLVLYPEGGEARIIHCFIHRPWRRPAAGVARGGGPAFSRVACALGDCTRACECAHARGVGGYA